MGVEPTAARNATRQPILKTGEPTGTHPLPDGNKHTASDATWQVRSLPLVSTDTDDMELSGFSHAIFGTTVIMVEKTGALQEEKHVLPQPE